MADWEKEPGETFCLVLPDLDPALRWEDNSRKVLPVTLENDDDPIYIEWARPTSGQADTTEPVDKISAPEGDPGDPNVSVEWPSQSQAEVVLTFSQPVPESLELEVRARTGSQKCDHPNPPTELTWAGKTDFGHQRWQANDGQPPSRGSLPKEPKK